MLPFGTVIPVLINPGKIWMQISTQPQQKFSSSCWTLYKLTSNFQDIFSSTDGTLSLSQNLFWQVLSTNFLSLRNQTLVLSASGSDQQTNCLDKLATRNIYKVTFKIRFITVLSKTGHFTRTGHFHTKHCICTSQTSEGELWHLYKKTTALIT